MGVISKAIQSAQSQDYENIEIKVLDDGSEDETFELRSVFPSVMWDRNEVPQGIIEARNRLMSESDADFYVSLDDDAWFLRGDEISIAVNILQSERDVGAIGFDILSPDRSKQRTRTPPEEAYMFIGCGHILRLDAVRSVGFYAPAPGTYGAEEKDLSLRLADHGFRVMVLPGVHVWHDKAWSDRNHYEIHRSGVCNEFVLAVRRCPWPEVIVVVPYKFFSYARFWIFNPGLLLGGLSGIFWAIGSLPMAIRTRKAVKRSVFLRDEDGRL